MKNYNWNIPDEKDQRFKELINVKIIDIGYAFDNKNQSGFFCIDYLKPNDNKIHRIMLDILNTVVWHGLKGEPKDADIFAESIVKFIKINKKYYVGSVYPRYLEILESDSLKTHKTTYTIKEDINNSRFIVKYKFNNKNKKLIIKTSQIGLLEPDIAKLFYEGPKSWSNIIRRLILWASSWGE